MLFYVEAIYIEIFQLVFGITKLLSVSHYKAHSPINNEIFVYLAM